MNHPIVDKRRVTTVLSLVSAVLLAACQSWPSTKPLPEPLPEPQRAFGILKAEVLSFKELAPGMTLLCPSSGICKPQALGPKFTSILIEDPRRVFLTCLADAQINCVSPPGSPFNQCLLPSSAADRKTLEAEAARKCLGFVQVP